MKKFLTVAISAVLAFGCISGVAYSVNGAQAESASREAEHAVYLVPGSYTDKKTGQTVYNTVDGAAKLTDEECKAISTPNVYRFDGETLPDPATTREGVAFNGWWTIEDAEIVYHETAPETSETVFLYADWRAELSQPKDPIIPEEGEEVAYAHYMEITRALTGKKEKIQLFVSGTDVPNAVQAGYGGPVQFYNEWFELSEGDDVRFYVSRVYGNLPVLAPQGVAGTRKVTLENSGTSSTSSNVKCLVKGEIPENAFSGDYSVATNGEPALRCVRAGTNHYRVYVKFYDTGGTMTIYMEKMNG